MARLRRRLGRVAAHLAPGLPAGAQHTVRNNSAAGAEGSSAETFVSGSTGQTQARRAVRQDPLADDPVHAPALLPPGFAVDGAFVQRFLTEGYVALQPRHGGNDAILASLRAMTPPIVATAEEGEALPDTVPGYAPGHLVLSEEGGQAKTAEGQPTTDWPNDEPKIPELEAMLASQDVERTLTALLGPNFLVDADRNSNFTSPGRVDTGGSGGMSFHRDGYGKRRHHHPRMLMGL